MTSKYQPARDAFAALSTSLRDDGILRDDVEASFTLLLTRYNTQIYENRFLVGGVAERIIAATLVAMGKAAKNHGVRVSRTDICVGDVSLSIKCSFRPRPGNIRLVNVMGDSSGAEWSEPTIFVISKVGIGYADPDLLPNATTRAKDAITLPTRPLFDLWANDPSLLFDMDLPYSREDQDGSDVASRVVADEIFRYAKKLKPFDKRTPEE
ncbi:MAG TPA: hypothetical protein PKE29_08990 [Phycisphaerales bacterium]|nr:hypothetical protein [Phycisphaerales bacterium]